MSLRKPLILDTATGLQRPYTPAASGGTDSLLVPFDWNSFCGGPPGASWVLGRLAASTALLIVQGSCSGIAGAAFTAAWTATLYATPSGGSKTSIGTIAFAAGGTAGTVTITTSAVAAGSVLEIDAPSTADSTGADVSINIGGMRQ